MNEYEAVSELVNRTGTSYNEAKYAYEASGGDMLSAVIMLERAKRAKTETEAETVTAVRTDKAAAVNEAVKNGADKAERTLRKACGKRIKITGKRDYFDLPLPAFAVIFAAAWNVSVPAFVISLFAGVKYVISGEGAKDTVIGFDVKGSNERVNAGNVTNAPPHRYGGFGNGGQGQYQQGMQGFGQEQTGFEQEQTGFRQEQPGFRQERTGFGQERTGFGQERTGFGQGQPSNTAQGGNVQIPPPVQSLHAVNYAGADPLASEDKGFFK
ncbi:MAG: hypothetical protein NC078_08595 [Ruminococcus sp.]|nr:hypothetical protein [Ruminococcus sp.]